jgi:hypothetical protein
MLELNSMNIYIHIKENSENSNMVYAGITCTKTTLPISYGLFDNKPQKFVYLFRIMYTLMHVIFIVLQLNTLSTHDIYNIHETNLILIK